MDACSLVIVPKRRPIQQGKEKKKKNFFFFSSAIDLASLHFLFMSTAFSFSFRLSFCLIKKKGKTCDVLSGPVVIQESGGVRSCVRVVVLTLSSLIQHRAGVQTLDDTLEELEDIYV